MTTEGDFPSETQLARRPFPGWWQGFALVLVTLFLQGVMGAVVASAVAGWAAVGGEEVTAEVYGHPGIVVSVNVVSLGLLLWLVPKLFVRAAWAEIYPLRPVALAGVLLTPPTLVGIGILGSEADNVVRSFLPMPEAVREIFEQLIKGDAVFSFVALVVVAPLTEELLFRGLILRGFLLRYSLWAAIGAQAFLFALLHANPWQFLSPLALGVLFGWLAVRTGSLTLPILGHAVINGMAFALPYTGLEIPGLIDDGSGTVAFQPMWLDLMGLTLVAAGVALLSRVLPQIDVSKSPARAVH